mmetsp:Transcript_44389/g.128318  ORF Transcript_44389/g.128318 Transcript_44389/m.128318 type:complete len:124 (-) Transcript_44389:44-415(-)|eukprot:CAMPEP_0176052670 /NCGR_PEP_ID=MMETSP0120_2-20121206/26189_1 /TAXON_ID=160619 /ORGANISM="Kryptoperidinium foliaceum, Strain CCMP 1326" /LENGTH=123 /DNA_ID=CAMNT_0017386111 /DNA_START=242 /DNA_END=613 /DNA_ORIENTATION=-
MADKLPNDLTKFIEANMPMMNQLGFGGVMGYCSGMAFRKVGKAVGVVIGLGFMGTQAAAASGYINVDWEKVKGDAIKPLDMNKDGKVDEKDAQEIWNRYNAMMTQRLPSAGGFAAGFLLGARR